MDKKHKGGSDMIDPSIILSLISIILSSLAIAIPILWDRYEKMEMEILKSTILAEKRKEA